MVLFILNLLIAVILFLVTLGADSEGYKRGTNSAARFVRDTAADIVYVTICIIATAVTIVTVLLLMIFKCRLYYCLPCLVMMFLPLVFKSISNNNKQRVTDARVVTKVVAKPAVKAIPKTVEVLCEKKGLDGDTSKAISAGIKEVTDSVGGAIDSMKVDEPDTITDEMFKSYCERIGINTSNGLDVAATEVLAYLPEVYADDVTNNSDLDKAKRALSKMWGG